jgi:hypothetical protein
MRILGYRISNKEAVTVADGDFGQHTYVIGASGSGKSFFVAGLMAQDIAAGRGFCFIDKHGDSAKRIADHSPSPSSTGGRPTWPSRSASIPCRTLWRLEVASRDLYIAYWSAPQKRDTLIE